MGKYKVGGEQHTYLNQIYFREAFVISWLLYIEYGDDVLVIEIS